MNPVIFTKHDNSPLSSRQGRLACKGLVLWITQPLYYSSPKMLQPSRASRSRPGLGTGRAGLEQGVSACPDKSGHLPPCRIIVNSALRVCPDLLGPAGALHGGHETKKDISMLLSTQFLRGSRNEENSEYFRRSFTRCHHIPGYR